MPVEETPLSSAVFDQLRQAMSNDSAGFAALYRDYLTDAWQTFHLLRESVDQRHFENIQAKAHYLKSSSLVLGAPLVARYATEVEQAALAKDLSDAGALLDDTKRALRQVQAELAGRLGKTVIPTNEAAA
ncbi:MAG TPA: Hpt domain-containing protein [Candidatus Binatia bacterium]|jgi:HPt (histidine-containing phosphotransfer) domain-containing protein|nr:Hpt domain-containing protein [Candidatus Binatia bacterium]